MKMQPSQNLRMFTYRGTDIDYIDIRLDSIQYEDMGKEVSKRFAADFGRCRLRH